MKDLIYIKYLKKLGLLKKKIDTHDWSERDYAVLRGYVSSVGQWVIGEFSRGNDERLLVNFRASNYKLLLAIVFACALAARFLSGSWIVALMVATIIFYDRAITGFIPKVSLQGWIMLFVSFWFVMISHYIRTVSRLSATGVVICLMGLVTLDMSFLGLSLLLPLCFVSAHILRNLIVKPIKQGLRSHLKEQRFLARSKRAPMNEGSNLSGLAYIRGISPVIRFFGFSRSEDHLSFEALHPGLWVGGGVLKPINISFFMWIYRRKRWKKQTLNHLIAAGLVFFCAFISMITSGYVEVGCAFSLAFVQSFVNHFFAWIISWILILVGTLDWKIASSLIILNFCFIIPNFSGFPNFRTFSGILLTGILIFIFSAMFFDLLESCYGTTCGHNIMFLLRRISPRNEVLTLWFRPVIISMGWIGGIHLYKNSSYLFNKSWREVSPPNGLNRRVK